MRVLVAMSGGVDSSMAAALLVEAGHDVTGVHLKMADTPSGLPGKGCCTLDDARDARRVADRLGVPFYVWDLSAPFRERVVDDFVAEYAAGRTPNPCIRCNERVKYTALLARARAVGFDALATGHHVRLRRDAAGVAHLWRAADRAKDQTYVLYMATQDQLRHTCWPVGEYAKADVRAMAADRGLPVATKPDSTDVCFIPSGDLGGFLRPRLGTRAGAFVGPDGAVVGAHDGAYRFTVGQRRGLGLNGFTEPWYVTGIAGDDVRVGPRALLERDTLTATGCSWVAGTPPTGPVTAQVRYRGAPLPCALTVTAEDCVEIAFSAQRPVGVAPGQAVVVYDGDECLGGGTIVS
ncbi:MAG: tRNA 2-thiouridine(34) synthase MnmA [Actinomycetota bacterium]|nr:tRNA 2-thiouridine(34) synthase MnmA [Actinomycetota bacterium]